MNSLQQQRGMTMWGWLAVICILGIGALVGIKLFPLYYDYWSVRSIIDNVAQEAEGKAINNQEVWKSVSRFLDVNYINYLKAEHFKVKKEKDGAHIIADYEVREHILGNVDAVLTFRHEAVAK
jgi:hypothetical protein